MLVGVAVLDVEVALAFVLALESVLLVCLGEVDVSSAERLWMSLGRMVA